MSKRYGPAAVGSVSTNDVTPPGAVTILSLRQINNRALGIKISAPTEDADSSPLSGFKGIALVLAAVPLHGLGLEVDAATPGAQRFDFDKDDFELNGILEEVLPIVELGRSHFVSVYATDGAMEDEPVPADPPVGETAPPPSPDTSNSSESTEEPTSSAPQDSTSKPAETSSDDSSNSGDTAGDDFGMAPAESVPASPDASDGGKASSEASSGISD